MGPEATLQGASSQETFQGNSGHQTLEPGFTHLKDGLTTPRINVDALTRQVGLVENTANFLPLGEGGSGESSGGTLSGDTPLEFQGSEDSYPGFQLSGHGAQNQWVELSKETANFSPMRQGASKGGQQGASALTAFQASPVRQNLREDSGNLRYYDPSFHLPETHLVTRWNSPKRLPDSCSLDLLN
jgi:hypothetical protein